MRIFKNTDGKIWFFSESKHGWVPPTDEEIDAGEALSELIKVKLEEKKGFSYSMAFSEVGKENPELAKRYLSQIQLKK